MGLPVNDTKGKLVGALDTGNRAKFRRANPGGERRGFRRVCGACTSVSRSTLFCRAVCGIIDCRAGSFDKVICSLALHPLPLNEKLVLLKEMRRVLRHGGTLHLADFDQPLQRREVHVLRGTGHLFGPETAESHLDGSWLNLIKQAGFVGVRRVNTFSEMVGRVAVIRARRS